MGNNFTALPVAQRMRDVQHFGEEGGVVPVIDVAVTSTFLDAHDMSKAFKGEKPGCYLYSRHSNPSVMSFGKKIAAMEDAEMALGLSSGMAAIACTIEQLTQAGDEIVCSEVVYGGTYAFFQNLLPRRGIKVRFINFEDRTELEAAITLKTKVIYTETLSNPLLNVAPFKTLKEIKCKNPNIQIVVDNTFAPLLINPLHHGADVVVHSCTKYISGAADMVCGAIMGSANFINSLMDVNTGAVMLTGPVMDPRQAHELYLRMDHLPARMKAHGDAAMHLAKSIELNTHLKVIYPGLESHPHHARLKELMNFEYGFGAMLTVDCGSSDKAMQLSNELQNVKFGLYAVSLGFSRTLMSCPSVSTSSEIPADELERIAIKPGLLRLSIGLIGDNAIMSARFIEAYKKVFGASQKNNFTALNFF